MSGFVPVKFRSVYHRDNGLRKAPQILRKNLTGGLEGVGKRLEASAIKRMRRDTGRSQKSLKRVITGSGIDLKLRVYSTLIQAIVDAYGLRRGVFPNFGVNSPLYRWTQRRNRGLPNKSVKTQGVPEGQHPYKVGGAKKVKRIKRISKGEAIAIPTRARAYAKSNDTKRATFLIARAIFRVGIAATEWHKKALEANRRQIVRDMQNALTRSVLEINRG